MDCKHPLPNAAFPVPVVQAANALEPKASLLPPVDALNQIYPQAVEKFAV